jgi:hypothetical protein
VEGGFGLWEVFSVLGIVMEMRGLSSARRGLLDFVWKCLGDFGEVRDGKTWVVVAPLPTRVGGFGRL